MDGSEPKRSGPELGAVALLRLDYPELRELAVAYAGKERGRVVKRPFLYAPLHLDHRHPPLLVDGGAIPRRHSCEGEDLSPPLSWSGAPGGTRSLALVIDDPDAPARTFTHWLGWALDPGAEGLAEGEAAPVEGRNDFGTSGYRGPCPPPGHGRHRYSFRLYAVDSDPELRPGAGKRELERALEGHTLATAELIGTYER